MNSKTSRARSLEHLPAFSWNHWLQRAFKSLNASLEKLSHFMDGSGLCGWFIRFRNDNVNTLPFRERKT
jgi:hypothetical protein